MQKYSLKERNKLMKKHKYFNQLFMKRREI